MIDREEALKRYQGQKASHQKVNAAGRTIKWDLSFKDWLEAWEQSGKWSQRGRRTGDYCLCRIDRQGDFTKDNIKIQDSWERQRVNFQGKSKPQSQRDKMSASAKGRPKSPEHIEKIRQSNTGNHGPKPVMTPMGRFDSQAKAAEAYGVKPGVIKHRMNRYPEEYYNVV